MEPFRVDVPDEVLNDLQVRLKLTRWVDDFAAHSRLRPDRGTAVAPSL